MPARAELLLAAELGEDAPGRPIYAGLEPDGDGEPAVRIKVGAMLTRRLSMAEATETPSGAAYGNPLRGRPGQAPCVPIGPTLLARTDAADAHGWRVYRVTPAGTVMYDEWIDHDPANGGLALTQLRDAARRSPEAALRRVLEAHGGHAAALEEAPVAGRGPRDAGGAAHERAQDERAPGKRRPGHPRTARAPRRGRAGRRGAARDPRGQERRAHGRRPPRGVSTGTLDASLVHPREVFRTAAMHRAAANRALPQPPVQGDPTPSVDDVALTERRSRPVPRWVSRSSTT